MDGKQRTSLPDVPESIPVRTKNIYVLSRKRPTTLPRGFLAQGNTSRKIRRTVEQNIKFPEHIKKLKNKFFISYCTFYH